MVRVLVQLELAAGMPRPLNDGRTSLFGAWLLERIASIAIDWPAVGFHRVELVAEGVRLVLLPQAAAPPLAIGLAIAHAVWTEIESAVLTCCGLRRGVVWQRSTVVIAERERRAARESFLVLSGATATRWRSRRTSCSR